MISRSALSLKTANNEYLYLHIDKPKEIDASELDRLPVVRFPQRYCKLLWFSWETDWPTNFERRNLYMLTWR